jgi:hypothetical protein
MFIDWSFCSGLRPADSVTVTCCQTPPNSQQGGRNKFQVARYLLPPLSTKPPWNLKQLLTDPEMLDGISGISGISANGGVRFSMSHAEFAVLVRSESERAKRLVSGDVETE